MKILDKPVNINELGRIEEKTFFADMSMVKAVVDIYYDNGEIEFDSLINPPRNREAGYPRVGRGVADPRARKKIEKVVNKWIEL